jgi:LPS export ABC transporter protein LptC
MNHKEIERWHRLKNIKKAAQFLVIAAVLLLVSVYAVSRFISRTSEEFHLPAGPTTGIRIDKFSFSSPGAYPWELEASSAVVSESLDKVVLKDPRVVYRGAEGGEIVLTARSGELDRRDQNVSAQGDVTIKYRDFWFKAAEITFSQTSLTAETSSPVTLRGDSLLLTGTGLKVLVAKREIWVERDVSATIYNVKWVEPGHKLPM